jgi:hypothetical protein
MALEARDLFLVEDYSYGLDLALVNFVRVSILLNFPLARGRTTTESGIIAGLISAGFWPDDPSLPVLGFKIRK